MTAKRKRSPSAAAPSSKTGFKNDLTTTLTITTRGLADKDAKTVTVHASLVAQKSPFLARLATSSVTSNLKLLDLDSDAFGTFAAWLYGTEINFDVGDGSEPFADPGDILTSVLDCYTLALKLEAPDFANAVLDRACETSERHGLVFRDEVINKIYTSTTPIKTEGGSSSGTVSAFRGKLLRRWIVDEWVWQFDAESVSELDWESNKSLSKEFLFEVMKAQARRLGKGSKKHASPNARPSRYHQLDEM